MINNKTFPSFFLLAVGSLFFLLFPVFSLKAFSLEKNPDKVENRFIVSPVKLNLDLRAGQSLKEKLQVTNRLGRTARFEIKVEDLVDQSGGADYSQLNSAKNWIVPEIESFSLEQGERASIELSVNVPENISAGGHYASIVVSSQGQGDDGDNIKVISRIGVPTLVSISGKIKEQGVISFFGQKAKIPFLFFNKLFLNGPIIFSVDFLNEGNIHLSPAGEIAVYNFLGNKVAQLPLPETVVLPEQEKHWEAVWQKTWLLGFYQSILTVNYGQGQAPLTQKESFLVFPVHFLLLFILSLWLIHKLIGKFHWKLEIRRRKKE